MSRSILAKRLADNLDWALLGHRPPPAEPEGPIGPRLAAVWGQQDGDFLRSVFPILLGRKIDPGAYKNLDALLQLGVSRSTLVQDLATSPEAERAEIDLSWVPTLKWMCPKATWVEVCRLYRLPVITFLDALWELLLLRPITQDERFRYVAEAETALGRRSLIRQLAQSRECQDHKLDCSWLSRLDLLDPEEFYRAARRLLPLPEREFVDGMYELLLGRKADAAGMQLHLDLLARGVSRPDLLRGMTTCPEYHRTHQGTEWLAALDRLSAEGIWAEVCRLLSLAPGEFLDGLSDLLLHRELTPEERTRYAEAAKSADGRVQLVRSLAESAESRALGLDRSWLPRTERLTTAGTWAEVLHLLSMPDTQFVERIYPALVLRPADSETQARERTLLSSGRARAGLIAELMTTPAFLGRRMGTSWAVRLVALASASPERWATLAPVESLTQAMARLRGLPGHDEFVRQSFRTILGREASEREVRLHHRRLRYLPFYSRGMFLRRLLGAPERREYELRQLRGDVAEFHWCACRCEVILERLQGLGDSPCVS